VQEIPKDEARRRAIDALTLVGLDGWAERPPRDLSGGMKQRVGLARALAIDPDVLLMDEPFSALDPLIRSDMRDELLQIQRQMRKTIIFITHDLDEALLLGDRINVMRDGRVVQIGTPPEIITQPADDYVARFVQDVDRGRVLRVGSVMRRATTIPCDGGQLADVADHTRELEDVFLVDAEGHPIGVLTRADVDRAARDGIEHPEALASTNFAHVSVDAQLDGAYAACGSGRPVAVLDNSRRLVGALDHLDVLRVLGGKDSRNVALRQPAESRQPVTRGALS
jgi:glycine betaine/proline transport system ATP-binding protein